MIGGGHVSGLLCGNYMTAGRLGGRQGAVIRYTKEITLFRRLEADIRRPQVLVNLGSAHTCQLYFGIQETEEAELL